MAGRDFCGAARVPAALLLTGVLLFVISAWQPLGSVPAVSVARPEIARRRQQHPVEEAPSQPRELSPRADGKVVQCGGRRRSRCCGDARCEGPETVDNCFADCPGVTTEPRCGEEPHSDVGGHAVVFGINHRTESAQACCDKCVEHAAAHPSKPCNSWSYCGLPVCWGLDTGWNHTHGECWLKWQADPSKPLYGQRGEYTAEYREKHAGVRPGCKRGDPWTCPPSHVPWTGGVLGAKVDPSVRWTTGPEGMRSSRGDELTNWRAWEPAGAYEKRLAAARGRGKRGGG